MRIFLRIIAAAEILGAIVLLVSAGATSWDARLSQFPAAFLPGAAIALLTAAAGVQLIRLRPGGAKLSAFAQALQVPYVASHWLNYKLVLGLSALVSLNLDSGWLGISAQLGDIESMVFVASDGSHAVGVNFLALALCWYLARLDLTEAGQRRRIASRATPRAPLWRRVLRFTAISFTVLISIVLIPVLGIWIYNRIDETPAPAAARWYSPLTHTIADRENAWLAMLGIDAADGDDPIALARRRLDAHEARLTLSGLQQESELEKTLAVAALPFDDKGVDGSKFDVACDAATRDCIEWARAEAKNIGRIAVANATRARRYESLVGMTGFDESYTPSFNDLYPKLASDDALYRAVIFGDLGIAAKRADALTRLSRGVTFWQRVDGAASSMVMKMLGTAMRERYLRLFDAALRSFRAARTRRPGRDCRRRAAADDARAERLAAGTEKRHACLRLHDAQNRPRKSSGCLPLLPNAMLEILADCAILRTARHGEFRREAMGRGARRARSRSARPRSISATCLGTVRRNFSTAPQCQGNRAPHGLQRNRTHSSSGIVARL